MTPRSLLSVALLLVALLGAACTGEPVSARAADATVVDPPRVLDRSSVAGLVSRLDSTDDPLDRRSVATVSLPGDDSLNTQLGQLVTAETARYASQLDGSAADELNITWDPVLAAGPYLGVVISTRIRSGEAADVATSSQSVYTDAKANTTWLAADLVSDRDQWRRWVLDAAAQAGVDDPELPPTWVPRDLRFTTNGDIVTVLGTDELGGSSGDVAVRVESNIAANALTDVGRQIQQAALAASPFSGLPDPPATPSPEPATVPPVSGTKQPAEKRTKVNCRKAKCIALTFDDGPGPYTRDLLAALKRKKAKVTFFLVGSNVAANPSVARAEVNAGHAIGNHTWDHANLRGLSRAEISDEIDRTAAAIKKATGVTTNLMRPPYGATNPRVAAMLRQRGDAQILWSVDTRDWQNRDAKTTTKRALAGARRGGIILMHDIHPSTVKATPGIIVALRKRGFTLVTVPQLLAGKLKPGATYFTR